MKMLDPYIEDIAKIVVLDSEEKIHEIKVVLASIALDAGHDSRLFQDCWEFVTENYENKNGP